MMDRLTHPTGPGISMPDDVYQAWLRRDLEPHLHQGLSARAGGVRAADRHAESLYQRVIDPASWTPYPDTAQVLDGLHGLVACARWCPTSPGTSARRSTTSAPVPTSSCCRSKSA